MQRHADKIHKNKSDAVANTVSQKKNNSSSAFQFVDNRPETIQMQKLQEMANNYTQENAFQFVDNRQEAVAQRKLQALVNSSPQVKQAAQLQTMMNKNSVHQQHPIQKKENNTGLPDKLKTGMENLSGMSLDSVKVHRNSEKPAQLQAHAYAQGSDIHLGPGQEKHLPHEAWHVVQQKQGRVKPTIQMKGEVNVNDDVGLEKEADAMGAIAVQLEPLVPENPLLESTQENEPVKEIKESSKEPTNIIQRALIVGARKVRVSKVTLKGTCIRESGSLHEQWVALGEAKQEQLMTLIEPAGQSFTGDSLEAIYNAHFGPTATSGGKAQEDEPKAKRSIRFQIGSSTVTAEVLNDSGGYHIILQHPNDKNLVIRLRSDREATSVPRGMENLKLLQKNLSQASKMIRIPKVTALEDIGYVVEKVDSSVDAIIFWQQAERAITNSEEYNLACRRLVAIRELCMANLDAARNRRQEPFPDFRPANVGVKTGSPELIYIDFDQAGEVQDLATLSSHLEQWAGLRYRKDPGGARNINPELMAFLSGTGSLPQGLSDSSGSGALGIGKRPGSSASFTSSSSAPAVSDSEFLEDRQGDYGNIIDNGQLLTIGPSTYRVGAVADNGDCLYATLISLGAAGGSVRTLRDQIAEYEDAGDAFGNHAHTEGVRGRAYGTVDEDLEAYAELNGGIFVVHVFGHGKVGGELQTNRVGSRGTEYHILLQGAHFRPLTEV